MAISNASLLGQPVFFYFLFFFVLLLFLLLFLLLLLLLSLFWIDRMDSPMIEMKSEYKLI